MLVSRYSNREGRLLYVVRSEDSFVDKAIEPIGEDVACDAEAVVELVEAAQAEEGVPDDQQRPALADQLERAREP